MNATEIEVYNKDLGLEGTMSQLIDWCYRYDGDYTDEALKEISRLAKEYGMPESDQQIPILVMKDRQRTEKCDGTLPYEQMKLDRLRGGKIGYEETKDYGEVEIREEGDKVLVAITGVDDEGTFTAANAFSVEEFMGGEDGFLESAVGETLFYGKQYE